jgi:hypothetical protein
MCSGSSVGEIPPYTNHTRNTAIKPKATANDRLESLAASDLKYVPNRNCPAEAHLRPHGHDQKNTKSHRQTRGQSRANAPRDAGNESGEAWGFPGPDIQQVQKYEKGTNRIGANRLQHISHILQVPAAFVFDGAQHLAGMPVAAGFEDAPSPAYVTDFLATSDGLALTKAFMRIPNAKLRRRIVNLVEQMQVKRAINAAPISSVARHKSFRADVSLIDAGTTAKPPTRPRRLHSIVDTTSPVWLVLLRIEADEKGAKAVYVLETMRHTRRNVKDVAGLQRLLDSALYRSARGIV